MREHTLCLLQTITTYSGFKRYVSSSKFRCKSTLILRSRGTQYPKAMSIFSALVIPYSYKTRRICTFTSLTIHSINIDQRELLIRMRVSSLQFVRKICGKNKNNNFVTNASKHRKKKNKKQQENSSILNSFKISKRKPIFTRGSEPPISRAFSEVFNHYANRSATVFRSQS